jgi:hypothetical protein
MNSKSLVSRRLEGPPRAALTVFRRLHGRHIGDYIAWWTATPSARKPASACTRNSAWIYQGETVGEIVHDGIAMLGACGLHDAADLLSAAASGRASGTGR